MRSTREIAANVPRDVVGLRLQLQMLAIGVVEAIHGAAGEAHRLEDFGIARVGVGDGIAGDRRLPGGDAAGAW